MSRARVYLEYIAKALISAGLLAVAWHAGAQTLPSGFSATRLFSATTLSAPTSLAFTPDGRMLITLQGGNLRVAQGGAVLATPALSLGTKVCSNSERGLLGVAVDPQFSTNNYIYLYYTFRKFPAAQNPCESAQPTSTLNPVNRVSRFVLQASNLVNPQSEVVLFDNIPSPGGNHNGGDLHFGKDGFLYISVGDGGEDYAGNSGGGPVNDAARDKHVPLGKILRIDRDGGLPATNPFQGAGTGRCNVTGSTTAGNHCQETFAWGFRNPFRFAMDPNAIATRFFINDVGQNSREEIDEAQAGADYGWNCREGTQTNNQVGPCNPTPPDMVPPIFQYAHNATIPGTTSPTNCNAITGGAFVPSGLWPGFDNLYLAADYTCGVIFKLTNQAGTWTASNFVSGLGASSATSLTFGPSGNGQGLYYTTYALGGQIWVINYQAGGNTAPTANGSAMPISGSVPLNVTFSAAGSSDPDAGSTLTYFWDFGDGDSTITTNVSTMHSYTAIGSFTATLRVRDENFAFSSPLTFPITVGNAPPVPQIVAPMMGAQFSVGQVITLTGSATDPEQGALPDGALSWRVILHHDLHTHPFLGPVVGNGIQFNAPAPEDFLAASNSYLEIELTATDSGGAQGVVSQNLMPHTVALTFNTSPAGLAVRVAGQQIAHGQVVTAWEGWNLSVQAFPQSVSMQSYYFDNWSDGGASTHSIATPANAASYTATYATSAPPSFDADANGQYDALTDGLLILRHLFGLTGPALTANAVGANALRDDPQAVSQFLNANDAALDVDGNGISDALTDGLLVIRYLFGLRGPLLIQGAVGAGAVRQTAPLIEAYVQNLLR